MDARSIYVSLFGESTTAREITVFGLLGVCLSLLAVVDGHRWLFGALLATGALFLAGTVLARREWAHWRRIAGLGFVALGGSFLWLSTYMTRSIETGFAVVLGTLWILRGIVDTSGAASQSDADAT